MILSPRKAGKLSLKNLGIIIAPIAGLCFLIWGISVLLSKLQGISFIEVRQQIALIPVSHIIIAILLTILNYAVLIGYDFFGMRYAQRKLPFRKIALTAFVADSLNANLGLSMIVGSSIKWRIYSSWGVKFFEVAKTIGFYTIGYWSGFSFLSGIALIFASREIIPSSIPLSMHTIVGSILVLIPTIIVIVALIRKQSLLLWKWELPAPGKKNFVGVFITSCLEWTILPTIFFILLPSSIHIPWYQMLSVFLFAHLAGMTSQVPGGMAVFESMILLLISHLTTVSSLSATLLMFRAIYYIFPFTIAITLFIIFEARTARRMFSRKKSLLGVMADPSEMRFRP